MTDLPPIARRITDLTDDLNKALAIANETPGLIARVVLLTEHPGNARDPWRVTVAAVITQTGQPAAETEVTP